MSPDGTKAYVTNRHANLVSVVALTDHREVKRISTGKGVHGMALITPTR
jgi:YVTN family beta-propeller protein